MAKKRLKKKVQRQSTASKLSAPVTESAREVWLAGLGAFKLAQEESGKVLEQGSKLFDRLVRKAENLKTRPVATSKAQSQTCAVNSKAVCLASSNAPKL